MQVPGFRGVEVTRVARGLVLEAERHALTDSAAQLAYYVLFAAFPFLFFLVTLTAYLPLGQATDDLLARVQRVMPSEAFGLLQGQLANLLHQPRPHLLTGGLLVALYSTSRGVDAFRKALNLAYDVHESRPWYRTFARSAAMTLVGVLLTLLSLTMFALSGRVGRWAFAKLGLGAPFALVWSWLRWPSTALVVMLVAALAYYWLPDVRQRFRYITPGSVAGTALWLLSTWGFTEYTAHFGHYNVTYGSIGGVILLLTWIYISGLVFLLGGELNAVIEHLSPEGKARGARAPGERPPPPEVRPSASPPGAQKHPSLLRRLRRRHPDRPPPGETLH